MGHASLADIFAAGTRAASPFILEETARLKEMNDLRLKNDAARFSADLDNYIRDNPYNGDEQGYLNKIQEYTGEWYGRAREENSSPYFQKNIRQTREQSGILVRETVRRAADQWRWKQNRVDAGRDIQSYAASGMRLDMKIAAIDNRRKLLWADTPTDPEEMERTRQDDYKGLYAEELDRAVALAENADDAPGLVAGTRYHFERNMPPIQSPVYDENGNDTGARVERPWTYEGRDEAERRTVQAATEAIQQKNFPAAAANA
jgi:hypothetical protein